MRRIILISLIPILLGSGTLFLLQAKKEKVQFEMTELKPPVERSLNLRVSKRRSIERRKALPKERFFQQSLLEQVQEISHLSDDEVKSKAKVYLFVGKGEEFDWSIERYDAIMSRVIESDPLWVLEQIEKREPGVTYNWGSRNWTHLIYGSFIRSDPKLAMEWYERGVNERTWEFFNTMDLARLAAGELLKFDPQRAIEVMDASSVSDLLRFGLGKILGDS